MRVLDFCRSFVTFITHPPTHNNARIQVEARCVVRSTPDESPVEYLLVASCKAENTYAEKNLFKEPNYDFWAIFSDTDYRIDRVGLTADEHETETGRSADRFEDVLIDLRYQDAVELLEPAAIVDATQDGRILRCQTTLSAPDSDITATLEYPVKTMNVGSDPARFQIDTGPIVFPDFQNNGPVLEQFRLAFVAFNRPDRADFVIQEPTPVDDESGPAVMHYKRTCSIPAENTIYACD